LSFVGVSSWIERKKSVIDFKCARASETLKIHNVWCRHGFISTARVIERQKASSRKDPEEHAGNRGTFDRVFKFGGEAMSSRVQQEKYP